MAAGATYTPIATQTLGSSGTVTFSSIPSTYTDLVLIVNGSWATPSDDGFYIQLGNGSIDTGTNYSTTYLYGTGSSAASGRESNQAGMQLGRAGTSNSTSIISIQNYSNTTTYKTGLGRGNNPSSLVITSVGLWRSTSAVNILKVNTTFNAGSTFTLYGISSA